jgi:hypothetical protein
MQATTRLHDGIANPVLQKTYLVFHHTVAFHPANRVFDPDADGRDRTIGHFLRWREFTPARFLLGLDDGHSAQNKSLEAHILIETTPRGQRVALKICEALIMYLAFIGGAQKANVTGFIDQQEVFERVALLLATIMLLLFFRVFRTLDWAFSTIMPKRGDVDPSCAWWAASSEANSAAVRAGNRS